jgi:hypothetical protein
LTLLRGNPAFTDGRQRAFDPAWAIQFGFWKANPQRIYRKQRQITGKNIVLYSKSL